jgi:3-oxoacyl-[acyl-carrier-protein] synthase-3
LLVKRCSKGWYHKTISIKRYSFKAYEKDASGLYNGKINFRKKNKKNESCNIGIKEKRFVDSNVTASDLCFKAAEQLLDEMNIDRSSIDMLIFLSQLPDYRIPANSPNLQHRLGLSKNTACFDISLACSGYVYALSTAFSYASQNGINRVLLLVGETFSKIVSKKDFF